MAKLINQAMLLNTIGRSARSCRSSRAAFTGVSAEVAALVPKYLAAKLGQIEDARGSLAAKDFESVRRFGHNLKGTGLGYGFPRIEAIGAAMEKSATDRDEQSVSKYLEALCQFLAEDRSRKEIRGGT